MTSPGRPAKRRAASSELDRNFMYGPYSAERHTYANIFHLTRRKHSMKSFLLLLLTFSSLQLFAQTDEEKRAAEQRGKLNEILQLQDRRTVHDGKLIEFLNDRDGVVRAAAAGAYGRIQDTS